MCWAICWARWPRLWRASSFIFGGPSIADPLLSLLVAALIVRSTFGVLKETTFVLLDACRDDIDYRTVGATLAQFPGVRSVHDLHVWAMVPGRCALSAHVLVEDIEQLAGDPAARAFTAARRI